jgi:hypothetical protein
MRAPIAAVVPDSPIPSTGSCSRRSCKITEIYRVEELLKLTQQMSAGAPQA